MKTLFCLVLALVVLVLPRAAAAEPRKHDGLYANLGLGYSYLSDGLRVSQNSSPVADGNLTGHGIAAQLQLGGTTQGRFGATVYGGSIGYTYFPTARMTLNGVDPGTSNASATSIAFLWKLYPYPDRGVNIHALVGVTVLAFNLGNKVGTAIGGPYAIGFGYDVWASDEWSFAIQAQVAYDNLSDSGDGIDRSHRAYRSSFTLGATFH